MDRLDLSKIEVQAGDKVTTTVILSPVSLVLVMHVLDLLRQNQWLFDGANDDTLQATANAIDEVYGG